MIGTEFEGLEQFPKAHEEVLEEVMDYRTYCWAIAKTYCWAIAISR